MSGKPTKLYIQKPIRSGHYWVIRVVDSISPLANVIEEIKFETYGAAYKGYRQAKKEVGDFY